MGMVAQFRFRSRPPAWTRGRWFRLKGVFPRSTGPALAAALMALTALWPNELMGQATKEYGLKAVLLFNFAQFVDWPPTAYSAASTPFVIGILGRDPFGPVLDDLLRPETLAGRRMVVERYRTVDRIGNCQILFVADSEKSHLPRVFAALHGRPVLTVGDCDDFTVRGGMVRFVKNPDNRISLSINLTAAKATGLNISAKLLRVADVVSTAAGR